MIINGNTTTVNTENIVMNDNIIGINNGITTLPINDTGIIINRGQLDNLFIGYKENIDKFIIGKTTANNTSTGNISVNKHTLLVNIEGDIIGNLNGSILEVSGNSVLNGLTQINNKLKVGNDKFIVDNINGDTIINGLTQINNKLKIGNDKFIVDNTNGNTIINGVNEINGDLKVGNDKLTVDILNKIVKINGTNQINGDLIVGNDKLIVNNTNSNITIKGLTNIYGNTVINGITQINDDFKIGNDKFIVSNINGNTLIKGTLNVSDKAILDNECEINKKLELKESTLSLKVHGESNLKSLIVNDISEFKNDIKIGNNDYVIHANGYTNIKNDVIMDKQLIVNNINTENIYVNNKLTAKIGSAEKNYDSNDNNLGLNSNLLIPNAFSKIEQWIIQQLIDTPPAPSNSTNPIIDTNYYIELDWILPERYYVGFLDKKLPEIKSICIEYKKSIDSNYIKINTNNN